MFYELLVHADGSVSPCCADYTYKNENLGNVKTQSLKKIWNSSRLLQMRIQALKKEHIDYALCNGCAYAKCAATVDLSSYREDLLEKYDKLVNGYEKEIIGYVGKLPANLIEKAVEELNSSNLPIFIWGGGQTAGKIKQYLNNRGLTVDGFLLNRKYYNAGIKELDGCPIYVLEDYLSENRCNLIVGFSGYCENQKNEFIHNIHKLYVLDFIGALCLEGLYSMISKEFFIENKKKLEWLEKSLCDEKSKKSLNEYIFQRMSGEYTKSDYELNQYFPEDIIHLQEQEIFVDCGAYHGESSVDFIAHLHEKGIIEYKKIICVEADKDNVTEMKKVLNQYENIEIVSAGVWDHEGTLHMDAGYGVGSKISDEGKTRVDVKTVDGILKGRKATYIKMDIEGAELKALHGAVNTIKKHKPKLAVCIYHKPEDLIEIPSYIYSLRNDYKFYIRNHSSYGIETVLYAV